jgi:hypothetical protein
LEDLSDPQYQETLFDDEDFDEEDNTFPIYADESEVPFFEDESLFTDVPVEGYETVTTDPSIEG